MNDPFFVGVLSCGILAALGYSLERVVRAWLSERLTRFWIDWTQFDR